jgi:hypothetical protein
MLHSSNAMQDTLVKKMLWSSRVAAMVKEVDTLLGARRSSHTLECQPQNMMYDLSCKFCGDSDA